MPLRHPSYLGELRVVLAERNFRRLFATRLISQAGDGVFTAGLGAYVFFNQTSFPNPGAAAASFAVLYLPYSLIGPFAGVFIDRWSRRQILVWSALLRATFVVFTASLVASGRLGPPLYVSVLAVLGVNRFFLSSLSAALPHVVGEDLLVMANAVAPTAGTIAAFLGGLAGLGVHFATGGGQGGSAVTLLAAGGCYLIAGGIGATMRRDLLGPPPLAEGEQRRGLLRELLIVVRGLASGAQHVWQRRPVAAALGATASQRVMYGILLLTSILLYRNYFYATSGANASLAHFTLVVIAAAIGYAAAAVATPIVTRRLSKAAWIAILLGTGGVVTGALGPTFAQLSFLVISLALGLVAQGVAICATTIIQQLMDDRYRGRVFAFYDMLFNVPFVLGAVVAAQIIPDDGKSYLLIAVAAAGYLLAAGVYAAVSRQELLAGPSPAPPGSGSPGSESPSATAQRRSS
ncbi:MAG TPA: MFS transporter [Streptosporangiaceae bacterium]|nr:MFS transporter [Streptosporangiaceae bacterium]